MFERLVLASGNAGKLREFSSLLRPLGVAEVVAQTALGVPEADEPYATFVENALTKARHASRLTGLPALADDSGLCVEALQGAPAVRSARFGGEPKSDAKNNTALLQALDGVESPRRAYFYCVLVLVRSVDDPQPLIADGLWRGQILTAPRGEAGFGYDPLFLPEHSTVTAAEMPAEVKNQVSHRAQALTALVEKLRILQGI